MLGEIAGDIIGSQHEFTNNRRYDFGLLTEGCFFTDDTVMTLAVAQWIMRSDSLSSDDLIKSMTELGRKYPDAGYGPGFNNWLWSDTHRPYNSYGNGSVIRVSPVALYAHNLQEALELAYITANVSHNHPEGIKGAQATAAAIHMAKNGYTKSQIRELIFVMFGYNLYRTIDEIRPTYEWNCTCQQTVPEAIIAFLDGNDYEDVVRLAVSLGGDADTLGAIAGSIAACVYPIPEHITAECEKLLPPELLGIMHDFEKFITYQNSTENQ